MIWLYFGQVFLEEGRTLADYNIPKESVLRMTVATLNTSDNTRTAVRIYPNPASEILFINTRQESQFSLLDMSGRKIMEGQLKIGQNKIDLGNVSRGNYIIKTNQYLQKLIVK